MRTSLALALLGLSVLMAVPMQPSRSSESLDRWQHQRTSGDGQSACLTTT
ncbi:MAG: hypothetical protein HKN29_11105 [Rhodothermales bacterium]|nr:hypothetical protein [Rhodothermales bacterium]